MTYFFYVNQGEGGRATSPFGSTIPPLTTIGTRRCCTCVCVFVPITNTTCFIAHIDPHVNGQQNDSDWIPTPAQGEALKTFTLEKLNERVPELANKDYRAKDGNVGAIVVCLNRKIHQNGSLVDATGYYVVQAIKEYFNIDTEGTEGIAEAVDGFVVDLSSGSATFLTYDGLSNDDIRLHNRGISLPVKDEEENQALLALGSKIRAQAEDDRGFKGVSTDWQRDWTFHLNNGEWRVAPPGEYN